MKVKDVMTTNPVTIEPDAPVRVAKELLEQRAIRHLPVVDAKGQLLGMLTDRDLAHAAFMPFLAEYLGGPQARFAAPRVRDLMTWAAVTTHAEATLAQAGLTMFQRRIGSLPVLEGGRLIGIVTDRDILAALSHGERPSDAAADGA